MQRINSLRLELSKMIRLNSDNDSEYQLAYYPKNVNAHYTKHRDALPDDGSQPWRRVTAIVYLRESNWKESEGGCLRIFVPVGSAREEEKTVDIEPLPGRLVLFLSGAVDHEVLPVLENDRAAVTSWIH